MSSKVVQDTEDNDEPFGTLGTEQITLERKPTIIFHRRGTLNSQILPPDPDAKYKFWEGVY